jgi:hypothetical protein
MSATVGSREIRKTDTGRFEGQKGGDLNRIDMNFESEYDDQNTLNNNRRPRSDNRTTDKSRNKIDPSKRNDRTNGPSGRKMDDNDGIKRALAPVPSSPYKRYNSIEIIGIIHF